MRCQFALPSAVFMAYLITAGIRAYADEPTADAPIKPTDKVITLFNGKNLDGLYTWMKDTKYEDPRRVFRVTDGMLHVTGDGFGSVTTKRQYRDYHLVLEYRWGTRTWPNRTDRAKDSGLLIHSQGADGSFGGCWMPSIEANIIQGGVGDFILVNGNDAQGKPVPLSLTCETTRDRDGEVVWKRGSPRETFDLKNRKRINWKDRDPDWKDVLDFRGAHDLDSPGTQWTRMDVICDGGHIQVFVNGTLVNEAFDSTPTYGKLQLQTELAEIFFRRWELWPLGKGPTPAPAQQ